LVERDAGGGIERGFAPGGADRRSDLAVDGFAEIRCLARDARVRDQEPAERQLPSVRDEAIRGLTGVRGGGDLARDDEDRAIDWPDHESNFSRDEPAVPGDDVPAANAAVAADWDAPPWR
jgi:hypothetical protein